MTDSQEEKEKIDFLVVDDQDTMLQAIRLLLKDLYRDKQVRVARSGKEALQIIENNDVGLLITDWNMPNMTGIELLGIVRSNPHFHSLPAMMISDEMDKEKFLYAMEEGVDGYQIKPFTQEKLLMAIDSIIKAREELTLFQHNMIRLRRLFLLKKYDGVINLANKISNDKDNPDIILLLAGSYYYSKKYDSAIKVITNLVKSGTNGKALHLFGRILMAEGHKEKALPYLEKALALNPINSERKIDVGRAYLELGKHSQATEILTSIKLDSPTDISMLNVGKVYLDNGKLKEAGSFIESTSGPIPETVSIYNEYAIQLSKNGEFSKSIDYYRKCLKVHPDNEVFLFNIAVVFYKMKNIKKAQFNLKRLLKINSKNKSASDLLKIIDAA